MGRFCTLVVSSLMLTVAFADLALADTLLRARVTVDASASGAVVAKHALTWTADLEGRPRTSLRFWMAEGIEVTSATSLGATLTATAADVEGSTLREWTVMLPTPLPLGESRDIELVTGIRDAGVAGIRIDADGGALLPGSGWFPRLTPSADELIEHHTRVVPPAGSTGLAAGSGTDNLFVAGTPARPFVAWGRWETSAFQSDGRDFVAYRAAGATGDVPLADDLGGIVEALELALGTAPGQGPWSLIDVGSDTLAGGLRTVFWDESALDASDPLGERDVAGALAAGFWTEALRFDGPLSLLFSRAFPLYLGDAATIARDLTDDRWKTEARVAGARRADFLAGRDHDHALHGLLSSHPDADRVARTRGALVVHMTADACAGTSYFVNFLRGFRAQYQGSTVDETVFGEELRRAFGRQHEHMTPYLETTDLPDFVLAEHGFAGQDGRQRRYRVEVENRGKVAGFVEIATYTVDGVFIRSSRQLVEPGGKRAVLFGDARRIARLALDPRHLHLQSDVSGEVVDLDVEPDPDAAPFVPSFTFSAAIHDFHWVENLDLELEGISILGFTGNVRWYETHHGPSGLLMFGDARVVVRPTGAHAESFYEAMGREQMEFRTPQLWVRFPTGTWDSLADVITSAPESEELPSDREVRFMYDHSFPTYFADENRAQVPPPGGALVIFSQGGVERRGYIRDPRPDGTVYQKFWDQLRGTILWEATL